MQKKELKKHLRGIRPIERGLEKRTDIEAQAIRGYCLAVRSALTDDGRPPLSASGLKLQEHMTLLLASLTRVAEKRGNIPHELERLQSMLTKGLTATRSLWSDVQTASHWVDRAAHLLSNEETLRPCFGMRGGNAAWSKEQDRRSFLALEDGRMSCMQ